ncbi:MAG: SUMF1/EgtB/PvdO family nonheme iron enzyme [Chloroflexi bacterium]|nr:SUMF1/EgtB/PvdO family nonheme iron enzyme [Chloroflexota bacterium]
MPTRSRSPVEITRPFYLARYEISLDEYDRFCEDTGVHKPSDSGWGRGQRPVIGVDWYDAVAYCNWLSEKEGLTPCYSGKGRLTQCDFSANGYRLPTEAEWEYAARGGSQSRGYPYAGGDDPDAVAWYADNSGGTTQPVGQKQPNELGLYDMSGNAYEWCWDWYGDGYYAASPASDPAGPPPTNVNTPRGPNKSRRSSAWREGVEFLSVAFRSFDYASYAGENGFRLARTALAPTTQTRPADEAVMVYVPAGEFTMGSSYEQSKYALALCREYSKVNSVICTAASFDNEKPAHAVALDGYWIDRTEVTNGQYQRCVAAGACTPPVETGSYTRESYYGDPAYDNYPVVWVTQQQAADYCVWAGAQLPTEAQWEYAARGPESLLFPWGNTFDGTRLNICDAGCTAGPNNPRVNDGYPDTAPVGSFPTGVSWCGALDLGGNVREWVGDWFGYYAAGRQVNPTGPATGTSRVPRGGCWLDRPDDARSANRGENDTDYTRHKVGFRCALCETAAQR